MLFRSWACAIAAWTGCTRRQRRRAAPRAPKKVFVFAAGAMMNFLVGVLILLVLNFQAAGFLVPTVAGCAPEFEQVNGGALLEGDEFYSINGSRIYLTNDIDLLLMVAKGNPIDLEVLRDGEKVAFHDLAIGTFSDSEGNPYEGYGFYRSAKVKEATLGTKIQYTWYNAIDLHPLDHLKNDEITD